jgi:hypothetical protein
MKCNRLLLVCALALMLTTLIPPSIVRADVAFEDPLPEDSATWHCHSADPGPCPDDGSGPWGYSVEGDTDPFSDILNARILCDGWGCSQIDVYIQLDYSIEWSDDFVRDVTVGFWWWGFNLGDPYRQERACGDAGRSGSCSGHIYILLESEDMSPNPSDLRHLGSRLTVGGIGSGGHVANDFTITYSGTPIDVDKCDKNYQVLDCIASGAAINGDDEDGETFETVEGQLYRMEFSGGPWNDGSADRMDVEFSFDGGTTWISLNQMLDDPLLVECVQNVPENPSLFIVYFTAPGTTFSIRVADDAGEFADNTGTMTVDLCAAASTGGGVTCEGQFTVGATVITTGTIPANIPVLKTDVDGDYMWLVPGKWYVLTTSGGPWVDNPDLTPKYDIAMSSDNIYWQTPEDYSMSNCMAVGGDYISVYFQGSASGELYLRVNDGTGTGEDFFTNSGSVDFAITSVDEYDPYPSGCALAFDTSNFVEHRETFSTNRAGITLMEGSSWEWPVWPIGGDVIPKMARYLVLETDGVWYNAVTPGNLNGTPQVDGDMAQDEDGWARIQDWGGAECVQQIDPIGHVRVFFDASKERTWKFRVHDPDETITNNLGQFGYNLYYGINLSIPIPDSPDLPLPGFCDDYYTRAETGVTITLLGENGAGIPLPLVEPDTIVAIQVIDGPWKNGGTESYLTSISDDNGASYTNLVDYVGIVCKEQSPDNDHPLTYLYGREGKDYRVRVGDAAGNFDDNTLMIQMTIYTSSASPIIDPWQSCSTAYDLVEVPLDESTRTIGAAQLGGVSVSGITPGMKYALEISGEGVGWSPLGYYSGYYSAEVSDDNGGTWVDFPSADFADCAVRLTNEDTPEKDRFRIYFTAEAGVTYRIKVTSPPAIGYIRYRLYRTTVHVTPLPDTPVIPPIPPFEWGGCNVICQRPAGLFSFSSMSLGSVSFGTLGTVTFPSITLPVPNVGGWVDYARCQIVTYFAWCDSHTQALQNLLVITTDKEPFGSIQDIVDGYTIVNSSLDDMMNSGGESFAPQSVIWGGGGGGETSVTTWRGLLHMDNSNPLFGGDFDFTGGGLDVPGSGGESYIDAYTVNCNAFAGGYLGNAANGFCWGMGLVHSLSWGATILMAMQLLMDLVLILSFIAYIMSKWIGSGVPG